MEKEKIVPEALKGIKFFDVETIENNNEIIYLEKQDVFNKKQAEKYHFEYREVNYYKSEIQNMIDDIKKWEKEKKSIYILIETKEKAKKLKELLEKEHILCKIEENMDQTIIVKSTENIVTITIGKISEGFEKL